jgi:hydroxyacylglutathione hydrolase
MPQEIAIIRLALPYRMGSVNCYLVQVDSGYVLIDTGGSNKRTELENELIRSGCEPGHLKLILLTHGDFDHTGNAAYLRQTFGAKIAMHQDDAAMAERGDMFSNRKSAKPVLRMMAPLVPILFGFGKSKRFQPDFCLGDGDGLSEYGFDAQVLSIPGHSKGSIGILTASGDLFCGDLLENSGRPALGSIMDDLAAAKASVERLASLQVRTVYPGHGKPFALAGFLENQPNAEH